MGVAVSGLYMEGARWDIDKRILQDSYAMEMFSVYSINLGNSKHPVYSQRDSSAKCEGSFVRMPALQDARKGWYVINNRPINEFCRYHPNSFR